MIIRYAVTIRDGWKAEAGKVESYFRYYLSTNQYINKYKLYYQKASVRTDAGQMPDRCRTDALFSILCSVKTVITYLTTLLYS